MPGFRGAEGKEKGKGVIVRWGLKKTHSKSAGRRTGIPPKAGCGTPNVEDYNIVAIILFNCQRAIILRKWEHSIEPSRSIESPRYRIAA
jgi:hypothetical protein